MKIGILTLPLHINYGGILQAYALQEVLKRMGHEVMFMEEAKANSIMLSPFSFYFWWYLKRPLKYLLRCSFIDRSSHHDFKHYWLLNRRLRSFMMTYMPIRTCQSFVDFKAFRLDALVVGSDQIWRPLYFSNIEKAYLSFADSWDVKRIVYAASFGTDQWEYSAEQTTRCKELIHRFDAVSVREQSGVSFCRNFFNREADFLLDPTLLLDVSDYLQLIPSSQSERKSQTLTTYILDASTEKEIVLNSILKSGNYTKEDIPSPESHVSEFQHEEELPSIEHWIRNFHNADFVFTDSFHGCVFSILFHKPFIVFGNKERGMARFQSLLELFGLQKRLILSQKEFEEKNWAVSIDWDFVDRKRQEMKEKSIHFLKKNLD